MRKTELAIVIFALALFFVVGPLTANQIKDRQQREEVREEELLIDEFDENMGEAYRVIFRASNHEESEIADIYWLKKAARIATDAGIPHFNVRDKKMYKEFNRKLQRRFNVVEGVIVLDNDPMRADYDAVEIQTLVLPEYNP